MILFPIIMVWRSQPQIETTTVPIMLTAPSITTEAGGIMAAMTPTLTVSTANSHFRMVCVGFIGGEANAILNELR